MPSRWDFSDMILIVHLGFASQATSSASLRDFSSPAIGTVRYPRLVPKDEECAKHLAKRTLTNHYNTRPTWLDLAHERLDATVAAAYDWPADLTDDEILSRLLALNLARASNQQ